ncbi:MAG: alpha/beta fold hydrolase [Steroidobacteraceae bacterium]|nr:alpha/beta fold hydrolase [Steroidobacteraceae bacterium]MDW8260219.1 alpha/beta fold hydrolase [Gammaproteobacteria bacterium]
MDRGTGRRQRGAGLIALLCIGSGAGAAPWAAAQSTALVEIANTTFPAASGAHAVPVRVFWSRRSSRAPLVLFSHGAYSTNNLYDPVLTAWAAAGFVVLAPTHRDSTSFAVERGTNDPRFFDWRLEDMATVLAASDALAEKLPALDRRVDPGRIAATGHSFGGLVAQTLAGATYFDPRTGATQSRRDPRVRAAIVFSGAGRFAPLLRTEDFAALQVPLLVTVGTEDLAQAPNLTGYQWRREPFDLAGSPQRYLLTLRGADHYLGGLVGRTDLPLAPQARSWLDEFTRVTIAFLQHYLANRGRPPKPFANAQATLETASGPPGAATASRTSAPR